MIAQHRATKDRDKIKNTMAYSSIDYLLSQQLVSGFGSPRCFAASIHSVCNDCIFLSSLGHESNRIMFINTTTFHAIKQIPRNQNKIFISFSSSLALHLGPSPL
jgi:hypothetical protein